MDEGLLNDLLECSVCLERLDTSSRVLPCQHTFCLKCLKVIVDSHRELRCPECRILVEARVEELPPNVLLMRILEGMKNAPRNPSSSENRKVTSNYPLEKITEAVNKINSDLAQICDWSIACELKYHAQNLQVARTHAQVPPHARAMHDYISKEPGDLSFKKGETIILHKKLDPFWYQGECSGRSGMFPITYVQIISPLAMPTALCKALYDFRMSAPDEEGCLAFDKGAIITVHRRVDENWAEGRLNQRVGIFPIAFVELNQAARQLMNSTTLNRPVPPIPEPGRASHSDHRHHPTHAHRHNPLSMSVPVSSQQPAYPAGPMSLSQPSRPGLPRALLETHSKHLDLIHVTSNHKAHTVGVQSLRIADNFRTPKFDYSSTPVHQKDNYQNVRHEHFPLPAPNFNSNVSSDSSSSMNTPPSLGVSSTTTPYTSSSNTSCESTDPSLPSSPDNNTDRNSTVVPANANENQTEDTPEPESSLNTSMGVLSLNESSTATNTSLNVSLPPAESPKLNASNASASSKNQEDAKESASNNELKLDAPSSSKVCRSSGPDSLLNFGIGLQAALSPSHGKEGSYMTPRGHREHHHNREKRHSLTPSTHLQAGHPTQNRHSAEILATSLLDHVPERERDRPERERERERRRRRSRSNERPLPAAYIALYPYKPQKPDELELKKGAVYTVTERCRDGWYKGCGERSARCGVFPGNYVAPAPASASASASATTTAAAARLKHDKAPCSPTASTKTSGGAAPDAPPRANSPLATGQPMTYPWSSSAPVQSQQSTPRSDKSKEKTKAEKSISTGVSLMKRLAAMKKCKSPPPGGYSIDNPVFEDTPGTSLMLNLPSQHHPVHVRSGSCPSQLLRTLPGSERLRHKERPALLQLHDHRSATSESLWQSQHRKSQSLDVTATRRDRHHSQAVKERFRCIVPYPPNSEYELELKVDDIVIVSRKRGDGWYKGTLQRTGRTGLFPASFVQSCPPE